MKNYFFLKNQFFLFTISVIFFFYLVGFENINFNSYSWLNIGDIGQHQIGWKFFKNDFWRFPLGINPNYGINLGNSIVFTDSIPLFAIFFKIFKNFLPINFQYFSLWIFISIYLQLLLAFAIIFKKTNDTNFSIIGSIFFIIAPVFLFRSGIHLSLMGQWIILFAFYIEILNSKYKNFLRGFNIVFSCSIHFYFTIILIIFNIIIQIFSFFEKKKSIIKILKEIFFTYSILLLTMFVIGYFSIRPEDGLGAGYGYYNLNLNSFFNPSSHNYVRTFNWSLLLPGSKFQNGEYEGFAYLGLGGLCLLFLTIINFVNLKYKTIFSNKKTLVIFFIFFVLAISHNVNFGDLNLISIKINNYLMALLSSIRASGRLVWPIYYLILFSGILIIYNKFEKNFFKLIILISILSIQLIDISPGLKNYYSGTQYKNDINNRNYFNDIFWEKLSKKIKTIRTIKIENHSNLYKYTTELFLKYNFQKTDIVYLARINRKKIPEVKYNLYKNIYNKEKNIFENTAFFTQEEAIIRHIYNIYGNDLYYYFRDNIWIVTNKFIVKYNNLEKNKNFLNIKKLSINEKIYFIKNKNFNYGLGWIKDRDGFWSDGYRSSILLNIDDNFCLKELNLVFSIDAFKKNSDDKFKILLNQKSLGEYNIKNINKIEIPVKFYCNYNNLQVIDFHYSNPVSLRDLKIGLNESKKFLKLIDFEITK